MLIEADLTTTPDKPIQIPGGIYNWRILEVTDKAPKTKTDGTETAKGVNIVIRMEVINNEEQNGRQTTYYVFIPSDSKREDRYTAIKRVFLSAGIEISKAGMNTSSLVGRVITASVVAGIFKDPTTGVQRETTNIGTVFIPADNVQPGGSVPTAHAGTADVSSVVGTTPAETVTQPVPAGTAQDAGVSGVLGAA